VEVRLDQEATVEREETVVALVHQGGALETVVPSEAHVIPSSGSSSWARTRYPHLRSSDGHAQHG